jgi:hypothetical protein
MKSLMKVTSIFCSMIALGCGDGTGPGTMVTLSFAGGPSGSAVSFAQSSGASLLAGAPLTDSQGNELAITQAQVVMREIELKKVETSDCDDAVDSDACEEFEIGPILIDLPVDGTPDQVVALDIPAGMYDEIEFEIHKISSDDEEDAAFRTAHPEFAGLSIRVVGTYNGQAFVFENDLDVEQEFDLMPPLEVTVDGGSTNITIRVGLADWFVNSGGILVDPATANKGGSNESIVKENIKQSVEAFEDQDKDGDDDDES